MGGRGRIKTTEKKEEKLGKISHLFAVVVLGTDLLASIQAVSAVFNNYSLQLFWGLLVILFQRGQDLPAKVCAAFQ